MTISVLAQNIILYEYINKHYIVIEYIQFVYVHKYLHIHTYILTYLQKPYFYENT